MHNFKELKVWQQARTLVKLIYLATEEFPSEEKYGLISQARRSAVSILSNIAEGCGRGTNKDFSYFRNVSLGSAYELQTLMFLSYDLELINEETLENINAPIQEVQKMTYGLIKTVKHQ